MEVLQNILNFRVLWHRQTPLTEVAGIDKTLCTLTPGVVVYRADRCSGYGYESLAQVPEVQGTGMEVLQSILNFRVLWHGRTELSELSSGYKHAVPVPWVFVAPSCRTHRTSGYGYECPPEVTEVLCRVVSGYCFVCTLKTSRKLKCRVRVSISYITHRRSGYE